MSSYLTPDRFKTMRTGAVTTGIADIELAEVIADASAIVDAYCNVPLLPQPHSFLGGTVVEEEHKWKYPEFVFDQGSRRVYLFHSPIVAVTAFTLQVAATSAATLPVNQFVVNHTERWIEVTSLAIASNSGLFGVTGWIVPLGGLSHPMAKVSYTYGNVSTTTDRAYQVTDGGSSYQTPNGFWMVDVTHPVTVTANGVVVVPTSIDADAGRITFAAPQAAPVQVTYSYRLNRDIATATGHIAAALLGTSTLQSKGMVTGVGMIKVGEITIDRVRAFKDTATYLDQTVPVAAALLNGHRFMWMA